MIKNKLRLNKFFERFFWDTLLMTNDNSNCNQRISKAQEYIIEGDSRTEKEKQRLSCVGPEQRNKVK